ncbi:MAG: EAL domain-containing protein [Candidatus Competibacter sp.]|nr:EAL domain-containing protein [Candidatus Competibacter sp.]
MPTGTEVAQLESGLPHMESEAMLVVDPAGRIVRANALAECLFDYPPGTLAGQSLTILIPARLRDSHQLHVAKYFGNPHPRLMGASMSLWGLRRDGSEFAAEISLNPLSTPEGLRVLAAIRDASDYRRIQQSLEQATAELERQVAAHDAELLQANAELRQQIAERAQAETALREAEAQYRQLVENQPDLICRFLPDTTLTFVNAAYAGFFARQPEELIGQRFIEFLSAEQQAEVWEQLAAFTPAAPARQYEHQTLGADGVAHWHLWHNFAFFDDRGKVTGFQSVGVDITERKRAEEVLLKESQFRRAIIERAAEGLCVCHNIPEFPYVRFTVWNPRMEEITHYTMEEINRWGWYQSLYPDAEVREHAQARMARMRQGDDLMGEEWEITRATGEKRMVSISTSVVEDVADSVHVLALIHDTTERKRAEEALFEAKERAQVTLHSIGDAVITTDARGMVDYLNPVAEALAGWTTAEAQGRPLSEVFQIVNEQTRQPAPDPVAGCLREGKIVGLANHSILIGRHGQEYHIDDSAAPIRGRDGQVLGAVLVFHDVTENRQLARQLEYDATHDALTGLINRAEFERRLERALASARQYGARHALCYLDLDQFKVVNDTAGHAAGDELLRQINAILGGMFRERDTLARIGGDEFGLLLDNCPLDRAQFIAQAAVGNIRDHRFHWEGRAYQIGASIGLVPITAETQNTAQLLTQADVACYIAKEMGRNRVHLYQQEDRETTQRHGEILGAAGLRDALEQGRFRLHYQPIVPLTALDPRPVRHEALLRVAYKSSPDEISELVLPAAFIPAAERYGLMGAIDRWVIQTAFREYAAGIGKTGAKIAINLSGNSLSDETLLGFIETQFAEHDFPPERVCFEITETAAIQNLRHATDLMATLKRRGSQLALDDFGSGLSSFHYLKTLPVDYLKIDGSFVKDMIENARDGALVAAINQMSHTLGIQTIAEYVHSQAIVERLREMGVDYAQGYFFGQPKPWGEQP